MGFDSNIFGNTSADNVNYGLGGVPAGTSILNSQWTTLYNYVNAERNRRGYGSMGNPGIYAGWTITASNFNALVNSIELPGNTLGSFYDKYGVLTHQYIGNYGNNTPITYSYFGTAPAITSGIRSVPVGTVISSSHIQQLVDKINYAGTFCVCNCNYCTCNCNYCTCNCNYSCTCNCNYSDIRLKTNIKFIKKINGVNKYSWNYIWDLETTYYGVIAQELLGTKFKKALRIDKNGYYMVNYDDLPKGIK